MFDVLTYEKGARRPPHARAVPRRGPLPRRHPALPRSPRLRRTPRPPTCGTPSRRRPASRCAGSWTAGSSRAATPWWWPSGPDAGELRLTQQPLHLPADEPTTPRVVDPRSWCARRATARPGWSASSSTPRPASVVVDRRRTGPAQRRRQRLLPGALRVRAARPAGRRRRSADLTPLERYCLVDDAWAGVLAGRSPAVEFLELARAFADETDLSVWERLIGGLGSSTGWSTATAASACRRRRALLVPRRRAHRARPAPDDDDRTRQLRARLCRRSACWATTPAFQQRARVLHDGLPGRPDAPSIPDLAAAGVACWPTWAMPTTTSCSSSGSETRPTRRRSSATSTPSPASATPTLFERTLDAQPVRRGADAERALPAPPGPHPPRRAGPDGVGVRERALGRDRASGSPEQHPPHARRRPVALLARGRCRGACAPSSPSTRSRRGSARSTSTSSACR